jgi:short subunit dehydrogenase-like uncharacterized protein
MFIFFDEKGQVVLLLLLLKMCFSSFLSHASNATNTGGLTQQVRVDQLRTHERVVPLQLTQRFHQSVPPDFRGEDAQKRTFGFGVVSSVPTSKMVVFEIL